MNNSIYDRTLFKNKFKDLYNKKYNSETNNNFLSNIITNWKPKSNSITKYVLKNAYDYQNWLFLENLEIYSFKYLVNKSNIIRIYNTD